MPTENKAVTTYLPPDLEEKLAQYCVEQALTRKERTGKSKPALGTGIVEILRQFFSQEYLPSPIALNEEPIGATKKTEVKAIVQEVLNETGLQENSLLKDVVTKAQLEAAIASVRAELLGK